MTKTIQAGWARGGDPVVYFWRGATMYGVALKVSVGRWSVGASRSPGVRTWSFGPFLALRVNAREFATHEAKR